MSCPRDVNPYLRPWYRRLFTDGRVAGKSPRLSRANNPGAIVPDRKAWLRGFEQGRADLQASFRKEG